MQRRHTSPVRLLAVLALSAALLVAVAGPASAADPGAEHGKHLVECVESALADNESSIESGDYKAFENALEDCHKAKSLLTPNLSEMVWGAIAFLIVVVVLMKFGYPSIKATLKKRQDKIRGDLESAEAARVEAESSLEEYRRQLADARQEAGRIIEQARVEAEELRRQRVAAVEPEIAELRARATEDIRLATERAVSDLQGRVAELAVELAEKVVERNLDRDTQFALIENYINQVGSN